MMKCIICNNDLMSKYAKKVCSKSCQNSYMSDLRKVQNPFKDKTHSSKTKKLMSKHKLGTVQSETHIKNRLDNLKLCKTTSEHNRLHKKKGDSNY